MIPPFNFQYNNNIESSLVVHLIQMTFPKKTLATDWYDGEHTVSYLEFHGGNLLTITESAFESAAFTELIQLIFTNMQPFHIKMAPFVRLRELAFQNAPIQNIINVDLLKPLQQTLDAFTMNAQHLNAIELHDLFGYGEWKRLGSLTIIGIETNGTRSLHPSNFTNFPSIRLLILVYFDIESIHPQTFNRIGKVLETLSLRANKLKAIQSSWFAIFLDSKSLLGNDKMFEYYMNSIPCDCDYFELDNFTLYLISDNVEKHEYSTIILRGDCLGSKAVDCDYRTQHLSRDKLYLYDSSFATFSYPRVELRLGTGDELVVKTRYDSIFRLLIMHHVRTENRKRTRCPSHEWLRDSIDCLLLTGWNKTISVARYWKRSTLITFFAILISPDRKVWPMHIRTIHYSPNDRAPVPFDMNCLMAFLICLIGLMTGVLLVRCRIKMWLS